ncbi:MAG: hypothetical protein VZQ98_09430 [Bacteroidales bacterium]|jgi:hypothetical protein|nr:hypothetical protein [Bacteroidales bacterium]
MKMNIQNSNNKLSDTNKRLSAFKRRYYTARQSIIEEINSRPFDSKIRCGLKMALDILDGQLDNGENNQL